MDRVPEPPDPEELDGILSSEAVAAARDAAARFGGRDQQRLQRAREAFDEP